MQIPALLCVYLNGCAYVHAGLKVLIATSMKFNIILVAGVCLQIVHGLEICANVQINGNNIHADM